MKKITIDRRANLENTTIKLSASKSESNRSLIIQALSTNDISLSNLSDARDTRTMAELLNSQDHELNVKDAGTTMRFLTAYCACQNRHALLTGTPRMQERPIRILVEALKELGADINYVKNEGYPPIEINGLSNQMTDFIKVRGDVSSQYISALLMIAPTLPKGLTLQLEGKIGSWPYITMTLGLMKHFGVEGSIQENVIKVTPQAYQANHYSIEGDWSGASYWYSLVALANEGKLVLPDLRSSSFQGDKVISDMMKSLGVKSEFANEKVTLTKAEHVTEDTFDFSHCPDMAQTVAVTAAAKGIELKMTGLESLRIKETDRIAALQNELQKIGADLIEHDAVWQLVPSKKLPAQVTIETYEDHRMAMAFAPLATQMQVIINDPEVVQKSYPGFWQQLKRAGFNVN